MSVGTAIGAIGSVKEGEQAQLAAESEAATLEKVSKQKYEWATETVESQRRQIELQREQLGETLQKVRRQQTRESSGLLAMGGRRGVSKQGRSQKILGQDIRERYKAEVRGLDRQRQALGEQDKLLDIRQGYADMAYDLSELSALKMRHQGEMALSAGWMGAITGTMEGVTSGILGGQQSGGIFSSGSGGTLKDAFSTGAQIPGRSGLPTTQTGAFSGIYNSRDRYNIGW